MKARNEAARLRGAARRIAYPVGRFDVEYSIVDQQGRQKPETHTLKLVLTCDEARQLGRELLALADAIDAAGGTKQ